MLQDADFIGDDSAVRPSRERTLTNASFVDVLANGTSFDSAIAKGTSFNGAHIYSEATAFSGVRNLQGASFVGAVLAGNTDGSGAGLSFTGADLTGANFSLAQCIFCDFTSATMDDVNAIGAYLPGAQFGGGSFTNAQFARAWLFCGDPLEAAVRGRRQPRPVRLAARARHRGGLRAGRLLPDGRVPRGVAHRTWRTARTTGGPTRRPAARSS